jgi:hypothetical protein
MNEPPGDDEGGPGAEIRRVLSCDLGLRPAGAPHFGDLARALRAVRREGDRLVVEYDPGVVASVAALVAAERACCAGIEWDADGGTLLVRAAPEQLDVLEQVVRLYGG